MTTEPEAKSRPPVYFTLRNQPPKDAPVADIELRHEGTVYQAELRAGRTKDRSKRTLWGTALPVDGRKRLELMFAGTEREELATSAGGGDGEYESRPGQVLLFFNTRGAELSGYFTVPETGEQLRPSVFMKGPSHGTGPLQTEAQYRAALAEREAGGDEEFPDAPGNGQRRHDKIPRPEDSGIA